MAVTDHLQGQWTMCPVHVPDRTQLNPSEGVMESFSLGLVIFSS